MEAFNTLGASPKSAIRAFTFQSIFIQYLASLTVLTSFVLFVVVLIIWACHTLFTIKNRSRIGAISANLCLHVIHLVERATETLLGIKIKVFWEITLNTRSTGPESILGADALSILIRHLASRTSFTNLVICIIVLILWTLHAFLSIKDGGLSRAVHTTLYLKIIDLISWAT